MENIFTDHPLDQVGEEHKKLLTRHPAETVVDNRPPYAKGEFLKKKKNAPEVIAAMARCLLPLKYYSVVDLGCNAGTKSPYLSAWGCKSYLGLERIPTAIDVAKELRECGLCKFQVCDIALDEWPISEVDVVALLHVFQHLPWSWKLRVLEKAKKVRPKAILFWDEGLLDLSEKECIKKHNPAVVKVPFPLGKLDEVLSGYERTEEAHHFWVYRDDRCSRDF